MGRLSISSSADPKVREYLAELVALGRGARKRWFWRVIGLLVSLAALTSAVVAVLELLKAMKL